MPETLWNAHVNVGSARVGFGWGVQDAQGGGVRTHRTTITITLPEAAGAEVVKTAPNETVILNRDASLSCRPDHIEATVTYRVEPQAGAQGTTVAVKIAKVSGHKAPPTGDIFAEGSGPVSQDITLRNVEIPGTCS